MQVTFKKLPCEKRVAWGTTVRKISQDSGFDVVLIDGVQCGLAPSSKDDPNHRVLHPLSGFPQELCEGVIKNSGGRLTSTLTAPVPNETDDEEELDDEFEG